MSLAVFARQGPGDRITMSHALTKNPAISQAVVNGRRPDLKTCSMWRRCLNSPREAVCRNCSSVVAVP